MMNAMREKAGSWFARVLLGLLALSFTAWGIGDIFTHASRDSKIASVAGDSITRGEFDIEYQRKVNELRTMLGSSFSPSFLKGMNIELQVLNNLIDQELIRKEAKTLGLEVGDQAIMEEIRNNKNFQDSQGKFDLNQFKNSLEASNTSEKSYYDSLKMQIKAETLLNTFSKQKLFPESLVNMLLSYKLERRNADVISIPADTAIALPEPKDADIKTYYEAHKTEFMAPETREGKFIAIRFSEMEKTIQVSAEEVTKAYKDRMEEFRRPETRDIEQLLYADEATALKAHAMLAEKKTVSEISKKLPPVNKDKLLLANILKSDIPTSAADAVFSLAAGQFTKPIQSDFGWHVFLINKVTPTTIAPLEEVKTNIEKELRQHVAEEAIYKLVNQLEDALAAGSVFETAAKDLGLKVESFPAVTKDGNLASGKKAENLPPFSNFLATVYLTDEKNQSALTIANDGSHFVVQTDKVNPERIKTLDEVRTDVAAAWVKNEKAKTLAAKADAIAAALKTDSAAKAIAQSGLALKVQPTGLITREEAPAADKTKAAQPQPLIEQIFALKKGESTSAVKANGGYFIATVKDIQLPGEEDLKKATTEKEAVSNQIAKEYQNELFEQYMRFLRDKYDVKIYQDRLPKNTSYE